MLSALAGAAWGHFFGFAFSFRYFVSRSSTASRSNTAFGMRVSAERPATSAAFVGSR